MSGNIFQTRGGTSGDDGHDYEIKLITLFWLRLAFNQDIEDFKIASNVDKLGNFDDIVITFTYCDDGIKNAKVIYFQVKHADNIEKRENYFRKDDLIEKKGKKGGRFDLLDYFKSFIYIMSEKEKEKESNNNNLNPFLIKNSSCDFIIYTNRKIDPELKKGLNEFDYNLGDIFNTCESKNVYKLNYCEIKKDLKNHVERLQALLKKNNEVSEVLKEELTVQKADFNEGCKVLKQELTVKKSNNNEINNESKQEPTEDLVLNYEKVEKLWEEFINNLCIFAHQKSQSLLDYLIKSSIKQKFNDLPVEEVNFMCSAIISYFKDWRQKTDKYKEILSKNTNFLSAARINATALSFQKKIAEYNIKYQNNGSFKIVINQNEQGMQLVKIKFENIFKMNSKLLRIEIKKDSGLLFAAKMLQYLKNDIELEKECIFIESKSLVKLKEDVLNVFQSKSTLIVQCDKQFEFTSFMDFFQLLETSNETKKLICVTEENLELFVHSHYKNKFQIIKNNYSFDDFSSDFASKINEYPTSFHSNATRKIPLINIVQNTKFLTVSVVMSVLNEQEINIGKSVGSLRDIQNYYVKRKFINSRKLSRDILKEKDFVDNIVVYESINGSHFSITHPKQLLVENTQSIRDFFEQICRDCHGSNVHLFCSKPDGYLHWVDTRGKKSLLHKFQYSNENNGLSINEENILDEISSDKKFLIIADLPGMGKSTFLTYLCMELIKSNQLFIIRLDLNSVTESLKKINDIFQSKVEISTEEAVNFIIKLLKFNSELEIEYFKYCCHEQGKIILAVDGFDEICPTYEKVAIALLGPLQHSKIENIIITTRLYERDSLEKHFKTISYSFIPFTNENQVDFIMKYWSRQRFDCKEVNSREISANKLVELLRTSISDKNYTFLGIPLQTRMLAETYSPDQLFPDTINLNTLFSNFVDKKFEIFVQEKANPNLANVSIVHTFDIRKDKYICDHQIAALFSILGDEITKKLEISEQQYQQHAQFLEQIKLGRDKTGLIDKIHEGKINFIHRNFAEYFVGQYLAKCLKDENMKWTQVEFIYTNILIDENYSVIRKFIDSSFNVSVSEICGNLKTRNESLIQSLRALHDENKIKNDKGQNILHIAVKENLNNLFYYMINILDENKELRTKLIKEGYKFKMSVLHCAALANNTDLVKIMVSECGVHVDLKDEYNRTPLFLAAEKGYYEICEFLLLNGANANEISEIGYMHPGGYHEDRFTPITIAQKFKHHKIVNILNNNQVIVCAENLYEQLNLAIQSNDLEKAYYLVEKKGLKIKSCALTSVCQLGRLEMLKYFIKMGGDIHKPDGYPPIHPATYNGHLELVKVLIESGADPCKARNHHGWTMLHSASQKGHLEILKYYIEENKINHDLYVTNYRGTNIFHSAANSNQFDVLKYLISKILEKKDNVKEKLDITDMHGLSVIGHAATHNNYEIVKHVYDEYRVNVGPIFEDKLIAHLDIQLIHIFSAYGNMDMIKILLENHKVDINAGAFKSFTPLHVAAYFNRTQVIDYLIENGGDVNSTVQFSNILIQFKKLQDLQELMEKTGYENIIKNILKFLSFVLNFIDIGVTPYVLHAGSGYNDHEILYATSNRGVGTRLKVFAMKALLSHSQTQAQCEAFRSYINKNARHGTETFSMAKDFLLSENAKQIEE